MENEKKLKKAATTNTCQICGEQDIETLAIVIPFRETLVIVTAVPVLCCPHRLKSASAFPPPAGKIFATPAFLASHVTRRHSAYHFAHDGGGGGHPQTVAMGYGGPTGRTARSRVLKAFLVR